MHRAIVYREKLLSSASGVDTLIPYKSSDSQVFYLFIFRLFWHNACVATHDCLTPVS